MTPAPHVLWFTHPDQINQIEEIIVPILKDLQGNSLNIIIRLELDDEKSSIRFQYGVLFAIYQKVTLLASKIDPKLTANLDLRVYLEHLCDIKIVTNDFKALIKFIIYENSNIKAVHKDNVTFLQVKRDSERIFVPESPLLVSIPDEKMFNSVALGGTFDHLHSGHKLMLSLAILISRDRILCGITASEMLTNKNHPEKLESLDIRMLTVQEFFKEFKEGSEGKIEIVTLRDPFGPTIELDDLDALIVSPETLTGGLKINEIRKEKNLSELEIVQVDFIVANSNDPDINHRYTPVHRYISYERTSEENQTVVASFISFLRKQNFSEEHSEGIEIAIQCLSETFELDESLISSLSVANLASLIKSSTTSAGDKSEAERQKVLGNEFIAANKPEEAVECYSKAIKIDPSNAIYFSNRAAAYSMMNKHFEALEDAKQSCKLNPSYSKAYNRLGKAHLALGEPEEAVVAFEKALELEPKDVNIKASLVAARRAVSGDSEELTEAAAPSSSSPLGGMDFSSFMNNPNLMSMAQQMMQSGALNDMLKDPKTKDMVNQFMANPDLLKKFNGGK